MSPAEAAALEARLLAAHAADDWAALVALYAEAAGATAVPDAAGFYLTQAYIYALETGDRRAPALRARLAAMGRETPAPRLSPESLAANPR
ncbi:MAG TPA: hypothetical protein DEA05_09520 [Rhodobacteraceae bacterium]|nr:hypothetical protein [Paracoccaceae bacterium]